MTGTPIPRSLPEARCPECGRSFDPNDPVTYWSQRDVERRSACVILLLAVVGLFTGVGAWLGFAAGTFPDWLYVYNDAILFFSAVAAIVIELIAVVGSLRLLLRANEGSARVLNYWTIAIAMMYFAFFATFIYEGF